MTDFNIDHPVFVVPMPINRDGEGPASSKDTVAIRYDVWDQSFSLLAEFRTEKEAKEFVKRVNEGEENNY